MRSATLSCVAVFAVLLPATFLPEGPLLARPAEESFREFERAVRTGNPVRMRRFALKVIHEGDPVELKKVLRLGLTQNSYDLEVAILEALEKLVEPARDVVRQEAYRSPRTEVRIALVPVLAKYRDGRSLGILLELLEDESSQVVLRAVDHLKGLRSRYVIGPLIELFAKRSEQRGVVWGTTKQALRSLTGEDFDEPSDWKNWWEPRKNNFRPPDPDRKKPIRNKSRTAVRGLNFFGMEVTTKKVLFVIDTSYSMLYPMDAEEAMAIARSGKPPNVPPKKERLHNVKQELIRVLKLLPPDSTFNILTYNSTVQKFESSPAVAKPSVIHQAIEFVRHAPAEGETNTPEALRVAFEKEGLYDTIYFLSDGAPRLNNTPIPTETVLEELRRLNRFSLVRIHTIGFRAAGRKLRVFLKKIAEEHNGEFRQLPLERPGLAAGGGG